MMSRSINPPLRVRVRRRISPDDAETTFIRIRGLARLLDSAVKIPGTNVRVGIDGLIGLIPGLGDVITAGLAMYIVSEARRLGAPRRLLWRMGANVAIDAVIGAVPIVGDLFDILWKANIRNLRLLERHLHRSRQPFRTNVLS